MQKNCVLKPAKQSKFGLLPGAVLPNESGTETKGTKSHSAAKPQLFAYFAARILRRDAVRQFSFRRRASGAQKIGTGKFDARRPGASAALSEKNQIAEPAGPLTYVRRFTSRQVHAQVVRNKRRPKSAK
jgi:hypothetical protein